MKFLRLKALIPITVFIVLAVVFSPVIFNMVTRKVIISMGEAVFKARVELGVLKTSIKDMSIDIAGLTIADKNDEWKNLIQVDRVKFGMDFIPLLSRKISIDDMILDNVMWGTGRETSGALSPRKLKKIEKKKGKKTITGKLFSSVKGYVDGEVKSLPVVKQTGDMSKHIKSIDPKKLVAEAQLETPGKVDALKQGTKDKYTRLKSDINGMGVSERIAAAKKAVDGVKDIKVNSVGDIKTAKVKISRLEQEKNALEKSAGRIKSLQKEIGKELSTTVKLTGMINDMIEKDYENILKKVKIPEVGRKGMAKALFGKMWLDRVDKVLYYLSLARKYMPPRKKGEKNPAFARGKGMDVVFYKKETLPGLLVKRVRISGTTGGKGKDNDSALAVAGEAVDISSDQGVYGKPLKIDLKGSKRDRKYVLNAVFNRLEEKPVDELSLNISNCGIKGFKLGGDALPDMESGKLDVDSRFVLSGDELDCRMDMKIKDMKFIAREQEGDFDRIIGEVLSSIKSITVTAKLYGEKDNLKTKIESNLDDLISRKLKAIYGREISKLKKQINAELNEKLGKKKDELLQAYAGNKQELEGMCMAAYADVQKEKEEVNKKIEEFKKEIEQVTNRAKEAADRQAAEARKQAEEAKKKAAEEKRKAGEKIKQKIPPKIKKLF